MEYYLISVLKLPHTCFECNLHFLSVCIGIVYYAVNEHVQDTVSLGSFVYDAGII